MSCDRGSGARRVSTFAAGMGRFAAVACAWLAVAAAPLPPNPAITLTDDSLGVIDAAGRLVSTATLCSGFAFDQLGANGPRLSPDQHWILVDVLGPFAPGNVTRNHALVQVRTGRYVFSPLFPSYLGVPATLSTLSWSSGELATLRYGDGKSAVLHDPPRKALPEPPCLHAALAAP